MPKNAQQQYQAKRNSASTLCRYLKRWYNPRWWSNATCNDDETRALIGQQVFLDKLGISYILLFVKGSAFSFFFYSTVLKDQYCSFQCHSVTFSNTVFGCYLFAPFCLLQLLKFYSNEFASAKML